MMVKRHEGNLDRPLAGARRGGPQPTGRARPLGTAGWPRHRGGAVRCRRRAPTTDRVTAAERKGLEGMLRKILAASGLALLLAGCGETQLDRGLSGSAIGAGVGAAASAATGGDAA